MKKRKEKKETDGSITKTKIKGKRRVKKREKDALVVAGMKPSAGHFHPLQVLLFPTKFSPHFGRKHFDGSGKKILMPTNSPPPPFLQLNTHQKCFLSHFLSSFFIFYFFLFSLKNPLHQTYPKGHLGKNLSLTSYKIESLFCWFSNSTLSYSSNH